MSRSGITRSRLHAANSPLHPMRLARIFERLWRPTGLRLLLNIVIAFAALDSSAGIDPACDEASVGAYALPSGQILVLVPSVRPSGLRWIHEDGRTGLLRLDADGRTRRTRGWTEAPDPVALRVRSCGRRGLEFDGDRARRLDLRIRSTSFEVDGVRLAGRLVLPADAASTPMPLVVEVQGSGRGSHMDSSHLQFLLPARGIAVFVYDKRGTGRSSGQYTQDFHVLARDAAVAFRHASGLMATAKDASRGFLGSSQGGWVAPLAATEVDADFVVVNYGLAYSALQEDREQVLGAMRAAGWNDAAILRKAMDVADAAARVVTRRGADDIRRMARLRDAYRDEPWWQDLGGEFTPFIANTPADELARLGPQVDVGTSWEYEPMPTLRSLDARQLWLIAEKDTEAPPEETVRRLRMLQGDGLPLTIVTFPDADHGMRQFELVDGERQKVRFAPGSQSVIVDWINGHAPAPRAGESFTVILPP